LRKKKLDTKQKKTGPKTVEAMQNLNSPIDQKQE